MRVIVTKDCGRECRKEKVHDSALVDAALRIVEGKVDADLGGYLVKQHVSQAGGRQGAHRAIIAYCDHDRIVVLHVFAKNRKANLTSVEQRVFRDIARELKKLQTEHFEALIVQRAWAQIFNDEQEDL